MLLISTFGRAGSSMLARFCGLVGYPTGGHWNDRIDAGMELHEATQTNFDLLAGRRAPENWWREIKKKQVLKQVWHVHGPRKALPAWRERVDDLHVLFLRRDAAAIFESMHRHASNFTRWKKTYETPVAIEEQQELFPKMLRELGVPHRTLQFPGFLGQYDKVAEALTWGGLDIPIAGRRVWEQLVDVEKVHS